MTVTERLTEGVRTALAAAGLPAADDCAWEVPRQAEHGDYATNVAMTLARAAKRPPRQIADVLAKNFPAMPEVARVEVAGPGFLNVFLARRPLDRKSTRLNSSHDQISYAVFCLKKKKIKPLKCPG